MFVGLDLGTSGVKVLLIDENQHVVASAGEGQGVARVRPGWSEQDPADWIQTTDQALNKLKKSHGDALSAVKGIGLSGQILWRCAHLLLSLRQLNRREISASHLKKLSSISFGLPCRFAFKMLNSK